MADAAIRGTVLRVDRFGNLVTNVDRRTFERFTSGRQVQVAVGGTSVGRLVATYAEIQPGEVCALFGSTDHLEVAANSGSAAVQMGLDRGALVEITPSS